MSKAWSKAFSLISFGKVGIERTTIETDIPQIIEFGNVTATTVVTTFATRREKVPHF